MSMPEAPAEQVPDGRAVREEAPLIRRRARKWLVVGLTIFATCCGCAIEPSGQSEAPSASAPPVPPVQIVVKPAPAQFDQWGRSMEARGDDGWYLYARSDADGNVVEVIVSSFFPAQVEKEPGRDCVVFKPGAATVRLSRNKGLFLLKLEAETWGHRVLRTPVLAENPVLTCRREMNQGKAASLRDFIERSPELGGNAQLREFFGFK